MKLYLRYMVLHLQSVMEYKTTFLLLVVGQFLISFSGVVAIYFMFQRFYQVEGFAFDEVLVCYAIMTTSASVAKAIFKGFTQFSIMLSDGSFDRILTRPKNIIFQVLASKIEYSGIGIVMQALLVFIYVFTKNPKLLELHKIIVVLLMVIGGIILFGGLFIMKAACTFFTIQGLEIFNILTDGGREFGSYPLSIYGKNALQFFTFIIPFACIQYYPFLYVIGKEVHWYYSLLPLISILFFIIALCLFKCGLRYYKSTGS